MEKIIKTEAEQLDFFNKMHDKFIDAQAKTQEINYFYNIAGMRICLSFAGNQLISVFTPALAHLRIDEPTSIDAKICLWDSESTEVEMLPPPCEWSDFTDRGDIWGFNSQRIKTAFHWGEFSVNVMDKQSNTAVYWVETRKKIPYWVFAAPLRSIFHWLMESIDAQLLHAAAVGTENGAVLLTGKGGVGKSSTALRCLENGFYFLGDDYVIVKKDPKPKVYSLYCSAKVNMEDVEKFPFYQKYINPLRSPKQEKAVISLFPHFQDKIVKEMPLNYVFFPEIADSEKTAYDSISSLALKRAMAFTTMCQLPYSGKHTHDFINSFCDALPGYRLQLGNNPVEIAAYISSFLKGEQKINLKAQDTAKNYPLITVIVPIYNGEKFIKEAIDNILSQEYPALEIIIVDDGSTDKTKEIIQDIKADIRYFYQENSGPSAARNRGIRDASGEFIAFLDVDDLWPENNLKFLVEILQKNQEILVLHGFAQLLDKNKAGNYDYAGNPEESFPGYIGAGLYRKEAFSIVGLFDEFMKYGEDADWFKRAEELKINLKKLQEITLFVRRHEDNMTKGKNLVELNALKVFKKSLDRVRNPKKDREKNPKISLIIPVYNAEKYIIETINSALNQDIELSEIIIVDDGSTDKSIEEIKKFGDNIILIQQENKGAAAARNHGIRIAKGEYLAFLDADDVWTADHLDILYSLFESNPELEMAVGMLEQFVSPELENRNIHQLEHDARIFKGFHPGAILIKRDAFLNVGYLNEELELGEFIDWFSRAEHLKIKTEIVDKLIYKRRLHETNQGVLKKNNLKDYTKVLKDAIKRSRDK